jgi:predicted ATPase
MLAEKLGQPSMSALANYFTAMLFQYRRDLSAVERSAEATIGIATEHGFPFWLAQGLIMRGWSLAEQSQSEIGVVQLRQGLTAWVSTGAETYSTYFFALLAEALARDGQIEEALEVLTEALARMERKNERFPQGGVASSSG